MKIAVFTSGRQDWGILEPVAAAIRAHPAMELVLVASGGHFRGQDCPDQLGGLWVDERVDSLQASDSDLAVAQTAGWTTALLAGCLQRHRPDGLLVIGDRTETLAAALAAVCLKIPLIHLHGGEETAGAIDNLCRHAITQLASLHFVAHPAFAERLVRMGEPADRVIVSGAPGLDRIRAAGTGTRAELAAALGRTSLGQPLLVFTHHPTTLGGLAPEEEIGQVLAGLERILEERPAAQAVMTQANTDAGGNAINRSLAAFAAARPGQAFLVPTLGPWYFTLLRHADAMVGNSSSGIVEAATFHLPVVDIGERQAGRLRGANVLHAPLEPAAIHAALDRALDPAFRQSLAGLANPYGDGHAVARILDALERRIPEFTPAYLRKSGVPSGDAPLPASPPAPSKGRPR